MKQYDVCISDEALKDLEQIYEYIADTLQSPANAIGQYQRIAEAILRLDIMPERFQVMDWGIESIQELRRMPVDHYSVFYVIQEKCVIVTNVIYSASDLDQRFRK